MTVLVTGGSGFIGSNFVRHLLERADRSIVNLDKLTYAGGANNLEDVARSPSYSFVHASIEDEATLERLFGDQAISTVVNFAAETHVDRSIRSAEPFVAANAVGTTRLLEAARRHWERLPRAQAEAFRFIQISTDEVYGALEPGEPAFSETHRYQPSSPYSASKAAADHMVRAYAHTHGLPAIIACLSNNYGPYQHPEKLIPITIVNALNGRPIPIYGDGLQIRDWLHVTDTCAALDSIVAGGRPSATYNVGGNCQKTNLEVVQAICAILDDARPLAGGRSYLTQIAFVPDRPGHDRRYAIDGTRIATELGWSPALDFSAGIQSTVRWYLDHPDWVSARTGSDFDRWLAVQYA